MSRSRVARELGVLEGTLRVWEGDVLPEFDSVPEEEYRGRARVIAKAREGGASMADVRKVLAYQGGGDMGNTNETTYSPWVRLPLFEADGRRVTEMRRRCELLLPGFLKFAGQFVAGGADIQLPKEASTSADFWGARSNGQFFGAEASRFGLTHSGIDPEFIVAREKAGAVAGSDATRPRGEAAAIVTRQVEDAVDEMLVKQPALKGDRVKARGLVFDGRPDLYELHRKLTTVKGGQR